MNRRGFFLLAVLGSASAAQTAEPAAAGARFDLQRPEIVAFVNALAEHDGFKTRDVRRLLKQARPQPKIIELMNRPIEKIAPWWEYREHFVTPERINEGVQFWSEHREALARISAQYQVPPEYLVAILGVETKYGRITGSYRVLDALATLAFDYPPRHAYFAGELEEFLVLAKENKLDPLTTRGSYAGAMGAPQFMPSQYRRYAVDDNTDQRRDLWNDWDDILASIANYLREHGWTPGAPVLAEVRLDPAPTFQLTGRTLELNDTVDSLGAHGVKVDLDVPPDTPAVLISAEQPDGPSYRVGFHNFYVITRYNASPRYAMAVHDLAQAILQRVQSAGASGAP
ncbi:MAG TPA: lytic murein transglycosylase B [Steroidobacteraceae bacterium]|nr:lytic murein transglycosylase B [Steroidobacteraceae bacterium]